VLTPIQDEFLILAQGFKRVFSKLHEVSSPLSAYIASESDRRNATTKWLM
jgi:hypothetical protein